MNASAPAAVRIGIPPELIAELHDLNPWWTDAPAVPIPDTRRHLVARVRRRLDTEIAPIVAVRGPRQVGKTTIQLQIIADLLNEGVPPTSIMRIQFDQLASTARLVDPILRITNWFEHNIATDRFNALARQGRKAYLFLDEVQNLDNWSAQLKFLVDTFAVKVLVTGSSALRIERGKDSLAGASTLLRPEPSRSPRSVNFDTWILRNHSCPTMVLGNCSTRISGRALQNMGEATPRSVTRPSAISRSEEGIPCPIRESKPIGPFCPTN